VTRYSGRQLIIAKCILVALVACIAGPQLADKPGELTSIIVVLAMVGAAAGAYEALSHVLALVLGRLWTDRATAPPASELAGDRALGPPAVPPSFRVRHVLAAFAAYLAASALVWIITAMVVAVRARWDANQQVLTEGLKELFPVALPASVAAGLLATLLVLRRWSKRLGLKAVAEMVGLSWGPSGKLSAGALGGATLGLAFLVVMPLVPYQPTSQDLINEIVTSSGPARLAWVMSAVILAPPVEELMFRGVLLGGLARTWSRSGAAIVSGVIFWLMHAPEWLRYWPAAVAVGLMTVLVTALRLRTRALGPCIAAHFVYNLMMAAALLGTPTDGTPPVSDGPKWAQLNQGPFDLHLRRGPQMRTLPFLETRYAR
jgi:membrane protease YdiL (CAAX protease family)